MSNDGAESQYGFDDADAWDRAADERERLAEEREQLANEREALANEREHLADEQERLLDQRYERLEANSDLGAAGDDQLTRVEVEGQLARSVARLERAVAERARAQEALERLTAGSERRDAKSDRTNDTASGADDDYWRGERRVFVASERERLTAARDAAQDGRDELADRRERDADRRDREMREREGRLETRESRRFKGAADTAVDQLVLRARGDLSQVREAAERQRRVGARRRQRARDERAEARTSSGSLTSDVYGPRLIAEFLDLTRELFASPQVSAVAGRVLDFALECLPGYVTAGVVIVEGDAPTMRIATDPVAGQLDAFQLDLGRGPLIEALDSADPVQAVTWDSWPELAAVGRELGITGALAFGLAVPRDGVWHPLGVFTLYSEQAAVPDAEEVDLGAILAAYLAVAAGLERDRTDLSRREAAIHRALSTRDVIGQAKGILMERQRVPAGQAFDILRRTSQRLNVKVHEVAARLSETGRLPD